MSGSRLRILQIGSHDSLKRGGAVQMIRLARGLAERGHSVTALFNADNEEPIRTEQTELAAQAGVRIEALALGVNPGSAGPLENLETFRALWRAGRFDVIHCHREPALLYAVRALARVRVPCFVAQRGTVYLPKWFSFEHRLLLGRRVDRVIAVAHAVKHTLVWRRLVPPSKIKVVYGGVESDLFHPGIDGRALRERRGVKADETVVTLPGALIAKKGTRYFIEAAARLGARRPGLRFWVVGSGSDIAMLRRLAADLGVESKVDFCGRAEAMTEVYAASDLVVCASIKGEGLTGTLREALAMARPVVTTDVAGNTELVEEGRTGFVAKPANTASLAAAIERALANPVKTAELTAAGRQRVLEWCDERLRSQKVEAIYKEVLKKKGFSN